MFFFIIQMFAINNYLVPEAECCETGETSLSLRVCVYTTIMQPFHCTVAHIHVCAHCLLSSMNATSGKKRQERGLMLGFNGQDCTYVHRIDWSSRSEWGKGEWKCQKQDFIHDSSFIKMKISESTQTLGQATTFWLLVHVRSWPALEKIGLYSWRETAVLVLVTILRQQQGRSGKLCFGEPLWFATGSLVSEHEKTQNIPLNL